jgi:tetratricopeptide (TPR) repeat protein
MVETGRAYALKLCPFSFLQTDTEVVVQCARTNFVVAGLEPSRLFCRPLLASVFLLLFFAILLAPLTLAQRPGKPAPRAEAKARLTAASNLTAELQSRMQTLDSAKQSGDPVAVAKACRSVLGLGLREFASLELIQGSDDGADRSARPTQAVAEAIDAYRRSNDFEDSPATRIDLAQAYFQAKRFDESLSQVTDVLMTDPDNARARYLQGKLWLTKKWYDEAVKSFRHTLSQQDDPAAAYLLGAALLQVKEFDQAKEVFRKLRVQTVNPANLHQMLADAYHAANYTEEFNRESRLAGPHAKTKTHTSSLVDTVIDDAGRLRSRFEPAKPTAQERGQNKRLQIKLREVLASALNDLGTAEAQRQQFSLALSYFHEAASWSDDVPGLMRNTGIAAARAQDYPECVRALRPIVAQNPQDTVARAMLGTALFATHSYADAAQVFTPLGDSVLQLHELAYSWAASLVRINKYSEATALLNKLEQQQLSTDTLILVAQLWSQMGAYQKAVDSCHRSLQLDPKLPRAHYFAGLALLRLDRSADAAQEFRGELQFDPDNTDAQYHLAFSLLQQSQNEQAVELLRKVVARRPDHAEANYELGKELLMEGKSNESLSYLEAAVRLKPQFEPAHYQLQSAYRALGRKADANREVKIYRALKAKSRNITLPPPRQPTPAPPSSD